MSSVIELLRRDPAIRSVPRWLILAPVLVSVFDGLGTFFAVVDRHDPSPAQGQLMVLGLGLWLPVAGYLLFSRAGERCSQLDLTLPIPARRLLAVHLAGVMLAGIAVLLASLAMVELRRLFFSLLGADDSPVQLIRQIVGPVLVTLAVVTTLMHRSSPTVYHVASGRGRRWLATLILLGGSLLVVLLVRSPWYVSALFGIGALAAAVRLVRSAPGSFLIFGRSVHDAARAVDTHRELNAQGAGPWKTQLTVARILAAGVAPGQLVRVPISWISIPFLLLWGMLLAGFPFGEEIAYVWITLTAYLLFAFLPAPLAQLHLLDALPITRRRLMAMTVLPGLVFVALGYVGGRIAVASGPGNTGVEYHDGRSDLFPAERQDKNTLRVPLRYCKFAARGSVPMLESPWGETHTAWSKPLFAGSPIVIYSPYTPAEPTSTRFLDHQIKQAVEAIYDIEISREIAGHFTRGAHLFGPAPPDRVRTPVIFLLVGLLYLLLSIFYFRVLRAGRGDGARKAVIFTVLTLIIVIQVMQVALDVTGVLDFHMAIGAIQLLSFQLGSLFPGGTLAVWIVCAALFLLAYRFTERRFERVEATP